MVLRLQTGKTDSQHCWETGQKLISCFSPVALLGTLNSPSRRRPRALALTWLLWAGPSGKDTSVRAGAFDCCHPARISSAHSCPNSPKQWLCPVHASLLRGWFYNKVQISLAEWKKWALYLENSAGSEVNSLRHCCILEIKPLEINSSTYLPNMPLWALCLLASISVDNDAASTATRALILISVMVLVTTGQIIGSTGRLLRCTFPLK